MSRIFSGTNPLIDLGDIAGARFEAATNWTLLLFANIPDFSGNYGLVSKRGSNPLTNRQFGVRSTGTQNVEVSIDDIGNILDTGIASISANTWYLIAVTCDTSNNMALLVYTMAGSLEASDTGTHPGDASDLTEEITIGTFISGEADSDATIAHTAYVDKELIESEILSYMNPRRFIASMLNTGVQFYLPLFGTDSPEPDYSGNENNGTLSGTVLRADNPPTVLHIPGVSMTDLAAPAGVLIPYYYLMG